MRISHIPKVSPQNYIHQAILELYRVQSNTADQQSHPASTAVTAMHLQYSKCSQPDQSAWPWGPISVAPCQAVMLTLQMCTTSLYDGLSQCAPRPIFHQKLGSISTLNKSYRFLTWHVSVYTEMQSSALVLVLGDIFLRRWSVDRVCFNTIYYPIYTSIYTIPGI